MAAMLLATRKPSQKWGVTSLDVRGAPKLALGHRDRELARLSAATHGLGASVALHAFNQGDESGARGERR